MRLIKAVAAFLAIASPASAAVFGVEPGAALSSFGKAVAVSAGMYRVTVPAAHEFFETYYVLATPETGVCKISAVTSDFTSDDYGERVRERYEDIRKAVTGKYGVGRPYEVMKVGSIWTEPREWAASIDEGERVHATAWGGEGAPVSAPDRIGAIALSVRGAGFNKTAVELAYEFDNFAVCQAAIEAKRDSVF